MPVKVATVESIATVKVLLDPDVSIPVPPAIVNVSESKSIDNAPVSYTHLTLPTMMSV